MLTGPEKFRPGIPGFAEFADGGKRGYGLRQVWVKRGLTVFIHHALSSFPIKYYFPELIKHLI